MNFIIIGSQRTGSTMLCDYLNKQNDIKCHYEIFLNTGIELSSIDGNKVSVNPNILKHNFFIKRFNESHITIEDLNIANEIIQNKSNINRFTDPALLIDILNRHNTKKNLGFKLFYYQIDMFKNFDIINYIKSNNIKIIHLYRENKFLQELSYQKRIHTNVSRVKQNENYNNQKINFDIQLYHKRSNGHQALFEHYNQQFTDNNILTINIAYEGLCKEKTKTLQSIVNFITNESNFTEISEDSLLFKKMNVYTLQDQIENFDEVYNFLKNDVHFLRALR